MLKLCYKLVFCVFEIFLLTFLFPLEPKINFKALFWALERKMLLFVGHNSVKKLLKLFLFWYTAKSLINLKVM